MRESIVDFESDALFSDQIILDFLEENTDPRRVGETRHVNPDATYNPIKNKEKNPCHADI